MDLLNDHRDNLELGTSNEAWEVKNQEDLLTDHRNKLELGTNNEAWEVNLEKEEYVEESTNKDKQEVSIEGSRSEQDKAVISKSKMDNSCYSYKENVYEFDRMDEYEGKEEQKEGLMKTIRRNLNKLKKKCNVQGRS